MENTRLIEDNKINKREIQIANEFKLEFDSLNSQVIKLDMEHRVRQNENIANKENLKEKICSLVGRNKGLQLFDADFNPKISQHLQQKRDQQRSEQENSPNLNSFSESTKYSDDDIEKSIYVDTSFQASNSDSGNNSTSSNYFA